MAIDAQTQKALDEIVVAVNRLSAAVYVMRQALESRGVFGPGQFGQMVGQAEAELTGQSVPLQPESPPETQAYRPVLQSR